MKKLSPFDLAKWFGFYFWLEFRVSTERENILFSPKKYLLDANSGPHFKLELSRVFWYDGWEGPGELADYINDNYEFSKPNFEATWPKDGNSAFEKLGYEPLPGVEFMRFKRSPEKIIKHFYYKTGIVFRSQIEITLKPDWERNRISKNISEKPFS